jgi:multiple sugar transport system substrate-binding protein
MTESGVDELTRRRVTRRVALRFGLVALAVPLAAACTQSPPAAAPAKPAEAKPTEAPKPAVSPAASPAASPSPAPASPSPSPAAKPAAQAPTFPKAKIEGKLSVVQGRDFHPDHNTLIEQKIKEFGEKTGYPLEHSYVEAYAGGGNVIQKLTASVQAGDAPDVLTHNSLRPAQLTFLDLLEDVDSLQKDVIKEFGKPSVSMERRSLLNGTWWSVQHFSRSAGYWARQEPLKAAGIDVSRDFADWDKAREAALKVSSEAKGLWGWGYTVNRSGDGEDITRAIVMMWGGQLTDQTGDVVVLDKDPYRQYAIAALEWLKELYTDAKWAPMLPPGVNAWTDTGNNEAYLAGKLPFTSNAGTMYAKAVVDKNPVADDSYLIDPPKGLGPGGRVLRNPGDPTRWYIMKGSKNREAGEQLIRYMLSPEVQLELFKISPGYIYPAYEWGWDEKVITENRYARQVTDAWKKVHFDPDGFTQGEWPGPPTAHVASLEASNFWTDMFGEILSGKPIPEALKSAHDRAVRVFKEFGAKGE